MPQAQTRPVETKVTAATTAAAITSFLMWILATYVFGDAVPEPVAGVLTLAVTAAITFASGWLANHTPRPDLQ